MSQITSPATYSISRPQDVIDIVNKNSAINTSIGVIFIAESGQHHLFCLRYLLLFCGRLIAKVICPAADRRACYE